MITVKNNDDLKKILEENLCVSTEETKFDLWLDDTKNLGKFVSELNSEWDDLKNIYDVHLELTQYQNSDDVWEDYFEIIHSRIQKVVDRTNFGGDILECVEE